MAREVLPARQPVIEREPGAQLQHAVAERRALAGFINRNQKRQRRAQVRRVLSQPRALAQAFADERQLEALKVTKPAMNEL